MKKLIVAIIVSMFLVSTAFAGGFIDALKAPGLRTATSINEICFVPYNVNTYGYNTGLHILPDERVGASFAVFFFSGAAIYASSTLDVGPQGWTGLVESLLPPGVAFRSPSMIGIITTEPGNGRFWVNQFVFTSGGFSHIIPESVKVQ